MHASEAVNAPTLSMRLVLGGVLACLVATATALLLSEEPRAAPLTALLCLPVALTATAVVEALWAGAAALGLLPRLRLLLNSRRQLAVGGGLAVALLGGYASNRFLTDFPGGARTALGYAASLLLATLGGFGIGHKLRQPRARHWFAWRPPGLVPGLLFGAGGLILQFLATRVLPGNYPGLHLVLLVMAVLCTAVLAVALLRILSVRRLVVVILVLGSGIAVTGLAWPSGVDMATLAARSPRTLSWRLVELARSLFDHDGDGVSPVLAGGDCDDEDPQARPLALHGRDCLGWLPPPQDRPHQPAARIPPAPAGPPLIVLVTIDSFRCGFGRYGAHPLRDACPRLTTLAAAGRARLDVVTSPATQLALPELFLGSSDEGDASLGALLRAAGYRTHVIATHSAVLRQPRIRAGFDETDESLVPMASRPDASSSDQVTERSVAWLRQAESGGQRRFLWAHYYDPHHPYVSRPGALFVVDRTAAYVAELRRTDAAVGRLADELAASPRAKDILLLVTADHGEELGEGGYDHHGTSLREGAVRIPFVAWSPGPRPARFVPAELPASSVDVRGFFTEILGGARFRAAEDASVYTPFQQDPQLALIAGGWKLVRHLHLGYHQLFHLPTDPGERSDRSLAEPERVQALGRRLGLHIRRRPDLRSILEQSR